MTKSTYCPVVGNNNTALRRFGNTEDDALLKFTHLSAKG